MLASPSTAQSGPERGYETTLPLVSRALTLFVAVTSVPVLVLVAALTFIENDPWWVVALAAALLFGPLVLLDRLRLDIELAGRELRYRVRPWHRRDRVVAVDELAGVERLYQRPDSRLTLRRVNLGRDWIDWNGDEVRYVLSGESGVRLQRDTGRDLILWFDGAEELARALDGVREDSSR
ncbi:hypothetical protein C2R22_16225 [Salinigranum rubrum]|uniref:PH domain-containing protein n=1 Tax=Salinigranum rubrum TaxID=755307 RepID=A0A2I8VPF6_9EURY|nr:hypothetical protein [Salinigranum rubrum]AUV82999.1 hypothetical protein C2R22_16225 [Salinigranum rubrum]